MRSRDAWLTVFAAALGIGEAACRRDASTTAPVAREAPSASDSAAPVMASATPPGETTASVSATASAASAKEIASARPVPSAQLVRITPAACGAMPVDHSAICGAAPPPHNLTANVVSSIVSGGAPDDERTLAMLRPRLRLCANRGLMLDPNEQGKLVVTVSVDAKGEVTTAASTSNANLGAQTASCMVAAFRTKPFAATGAARVLVVAVQSRVQ